MLYKKPSPKRPEMQKSSSKGKIVSPQKPLQSRFSPMKHPCKAPPQPSRDYFNYTPLRQNKSLTCSTPDLSLNKSIRKEPTEISAQRKILLDQGKMLNEKLKEFKSKIRANAGTSFTSRSNYSQLSLFCRLLDRKVQKSKLASIKKGFCLIKETFATLIARSQELYNKNLLKKAINGFKATAKLMKHASDHYKLQLLVRTFAKWNESTAFRRSSSETNESTGGEKESNELSSCSSEDNDNDLMFIAESFYKSSLKLYKGLVPWKKLFDQRKKAKKLEKFASENYSLSLKLKSFSALVKNLFAQTTNPRNFYKITLIQKSFNSLKDFDSSHESDLRPIRFRNVINI